MESDNWPVTIFVDIVRYKIWHSKVEKIIPSLQKSISEIDYLFVTIYGTSPRVLEQFNTCPYFRKPAMENTWSPGLTGAPDKREQLKRVHSSPSTGGKEGVDEDAREMDDSCLDQEDSMDMSGEEENSFAKDSSVKGNTDAVGKKTVWWGSTHLQGGEEGFRYKRGTGATATTTQQQFQVQEQLSKIWKHLRLRKQLF